jgi:hypothetical protein
MKVASLFCSCLLLVLTVSGCGEKIQLPAIGHVTSIKVMKGEKEIRPDISEPQAIDRIVEFVDGTNKGWETSSVFNSPAIAICMEFFDNGDNGFNFCIGKNEFKAQRRDQFWSKNVTSDETKNILNLLNVPEESLAK